MFNKEESKKDKKKQSVVKSDLDKAAEKKERKLAKTVVKRKKGKPSVQSVNKDGLTVIKVIANR